MDCGFGFAGFPTAQESSKRSSFQCYIYAISVSLSKTQFRLYNSIFHTYCQATKELNFKGEMCYP